MNLILLDSPDRQQYWPARDPRAEHVHNVLKMGQGDAFYVGLANGPRGMATISEQDETGITLSIDWEAAKLAPAPMHLIVGLPRPQTARRVLFEAAVFGVQQLHFFQSERGEPSYASSNLWKDEWQRHLHQGAEQAFSTTIPSVEHHASLADALKAIKTPANWSSVALDVYEATQPLSKSIAYSKGAVLAIGSERGWSPKERDELRAAGYSLASLGERVLKTETACVAAMAVTLAALEEQDQGHHDG